MNRDPQKTKDTPQVSPLAQDETYGERWYRRIFDWGANYWLNLIASAGFSQAAEHGTTPLHIPGLGTKSPMDHQKWLAEGIAQYDPLMLLKKHMMRNEPAEKIALDIADRSMARARSLTLLLPGFAIMIPSVWLGAKIKPWMVEKLNVHHYGAEALDDPTLQARHKAIEAEARPTFLGTVVARMGTVAAVQIAAQTVGGRNNLVNKLGDEIGNKSLSQFSVNSVTKHIGTGLGGAMPLGLRERANGFAIRRGLTHSQEQVAIAAKQGRKLGAYDTATQDFGQFSVTDMFYTAITALTIRPLIKLLHKVRGMTYTPKHAPAVPTLDDGEPIKVPANPLADIDSHASVLDKVDGTARAAANEPSYKITNAELQSTIATQPEQKRA